MWEWSTNRGKCLGQLIWRYYAQSTAGDAVSPLFDVAQHRVASTDSFKTHKSETLFSLLLVRHQRSWHLLWYGKTSVWNQIQVCVEVSGFTTGSGIFFFLSRFLSFSPPHTHPLPAIPFLFSLIRWFKPSMSIWTPQEKAWKGAASPWWKYFSRKARSVPTDWSWEGKWKNSRLFHYAFGRNKFIFI